MRFSALSLLSLIGLAACASEPSDALQPTDSLDTATAAEPLDAAQAEAAANDLIALSPRLMAGIDTLRVKESGVDRAGIGHVHYQQEQDGVPVFGGEAIVHIAPNGTLFRLTNDLRPHLDVDTTADIDATQALDAALDQLSPSIKLTADPKVELMVLPLEDGDRLSWRVTLEVETPQGEPQRPILFINAHDGEVDWAYDNLKNTALNDSAKAVYDMRNGTRIRSAVLGDSADADLLTTYNAVGSTLGFLSTTFGRNSYDNRGAKVLGYGHYSRNYVNAFWSGSYFAAGDGDGVYSGYLGVLDVTAHELGHAVTDYEANLTYSNESGALNEAASDILAAAVEAWVDGGSNASTWDIGEDCWLAAPALRFMDAPSQDGSSTDYYPARYTGTQDSGGVHWNSGIANHFFYLLSEGGQHHTAGYRSGNTITGIGIQDAYAIWYSALTDYMTSSTNFSGARTATESACAGLGYPTTTCDSVSYAWYEVGVGSDPAGGGGGGGGGGGTPTTCPSGMTTTTGTLTGAGDNDQYTYSASNGTHDLRLSAVGGTDYDLYLYKADRRGRYSQVAASAGATSTESILYSGSSANYLVQVSSYSGSGDYTLCTTLP